MHMFYVLLDTYLERVISLSEVYISTKIRHPHNCMNLDEVTSRSLFAPCSQRQSVFLECSNFGLWKSIPEVCSKTSDYKHKWMSQCLCFKSEFSASKQFGWNVPYTRLSLHLLQITAVGGFISIRVVAVRTSNRLIDNIVQIWYDT